MKRILTAINEHGRSYAASVEEYKDKTPDVIWTFDPKDIRAAIAGIDPATAADWIGPEAQGGVVWRYAPVPPATETEHHAGPGIDENGFHTTRTIDFDLILEGELTLILDEERIRLSRGDFVIQQATRHAWKNESSETAVLLALMHRPVL
jgi:hypothetical protein